MQHDLARRDPDAVPGGGRNGRQPDGHYHDDHLKPGQVVGAVVNQGNDPVVVTMQTDLGASAQFSQTRVKVPAHGITQVGPSGTEVPLADTPVEPGALMQISANYQPTGGVSLTVPVVLPKVVFEPTTTKPENVALSVRGSKTGKCEVYWGQTPVSPQELLDRSVAKLKLEIDKQGGPNAPGLELPEAHIRGDVNTPWRCVGGAMTNLQRAGFARVGFISEPPAGFVHERM